MSISGAAVIAACFVVGALIIYYGRKTLEEYSDGVICELCDARIEWEDATSSDSTEEGDNLIYLCKECVEAERREFGYGARLEGEG